MREHRESWTNSVKDVRDPFVNTVTRARHARVYTADKGETFTSFTDANSTARKRTVVDSAPAVILALDLGQRTGWAVRSRDGAIASGTEEFRPGRFEGGGIKFLKFKRWLTELKRCAGGLDLVVFEEVRRHLGVDSAHAFGGWLAILTTWCEREGVAYQGVPVGTIMRHVTGRGNADKQAVIAAVKALGFSPADDNQADALALLHWAIAQGMRGAR